CPSAIAPSQQPCCKKGGRASCPQYHPRARRSRSLSLRSAKMTSPFLDPYEGIEKHRHRLPHWQQGEAWQFVTWRLADSLPWEKLREWQLKKEAWILQNPEPRPPEAEKEYHRLFSDRMEKWLDRGHGSCALRDQRAAAIVERALRHFDKERYALGPFVIMPNHVHVLFRPLIGFAL